MADPILKFVVDGVELPSDTWVRRVEVVEELSARTTAEVQLSSATVIDLPTSLGKVVRLRATGPAERAWTLVVASILYDGHDRGAHRTTLSLSDPLLPLSLRVNTRKFRKVPAEEIVASVLREHGAKVRVDVAATPARSFCVQYRESDLAFVQRLCEHEGFFLALEEDGSFHLGDDSRTCPRLRGGAPIQLVEAAEGMNEVGWNVHELRRGARLRTSTVTLGDYDWQNPELGLRSTASVPDGIADLEVYDYPAGFRDESRGSALAKRRLDALQVGASYLEGEGAAIDFRAGTAFALDPAVPGAFGGEWLLVKVKHTALAEEDGRASGAYRNTFEAIPFEQPFRPAPRTPKPRVAGHHTAFVRGPAGEEIHTDRFGRFIAQMHWDRDAQANDADSRWLRLVQETSSSMVLARTGWEVHVGFLDGDPDRPLGLGRAINGQAPPQYAQPANKTKMSVQTPSSPGGGGYSEIAMDDAKGSQRMEFRAQKDWEGLVKNDREEEIGRDETREVGAAQALRTMGARTTTIGKDESVDLGKSTSRSVKKDRSVTIGGSESVDVGSAATDTVDGKDSEKVGVVRISLVGSLKMPDFKAMAKQALEGLVPAPIRSVQALAAGGSAGAEQFLGGAFGDAANAAGAALVTGGAPVGAAGESLQGSFQGQFGGFFGGGSMPGSGDLSGQLSQQGASTGFTTQIQGALSTATGGLSDMFLTQKDGQLSLTKIDFSWEQAGKLIDMFAIGGINRASTINTLRLVGGAEIEAAVGAIDWSSSGLHLETVGAMKMTNAAKGIAQEVRGVLKTTVAGPFIQTGIGGVTSKTKTLSTITVKTKTKIDSKANIVISADGAVTIKAGDELSIDAGGGGSTVKLTKSSAVLATPKVGISAAKECSIAHKTVDLTKGG